VSFVSIEYFPGAIGAKSRYFSPPSLVTGNLRSNCTVNPQTG